MTLHKDREKNLRPPMRRWVFVLIMGIVVAVFAYVFITLAVTGQPLF
jgi:hypothetical protein